MDSLLPIIGTLSGVVIGWGLQEGSKIIKERRSLLKKQTAITGELKSIYRQIPFVLDIIQKAVEALNQGRCLPCQHTHFISIAYNGYITYLYKNYSEEERNCLHIIYETLRVADEYLDSHHYELFKDSERTSVADPFAAHKGMLIDIGNSLDRTKQLVGSLLNNKPIDVFPILK